MLDPKGSFFAFFHNSAHQPQVLNVAAVKRFNFLFQQLYFTIFTEEMQGAVEDFACFRRWMHYNKDSILKTTIGSAAEEL